MTISIRQLRPTFAGEVSGVDIAKPLDRADAAAIEAAIDTYAVLVFRDQPLSDAQQIAFTLNFGELESYKSPGHIRRREEHRLGPGIAPGPALRSQRGPRRAADHSGRPPSGGRPGPATPR